MALPTPVTRPNPVAKLIEALRGRRVVALSGAGCSTESGIPDYRGPDGRMRVRSPMQYGDFVRRREGRTRYWARSAVGWGRVSGARPNGGHLALARLEAMGVVRGIITQNVDGLHQAAGSGRVVELHGTLSYVRCLGCRDRVPRGRFQSRLLRENRSWLEARAAGTRAPVTAAPDGDADLADEALAGFRVPECARCGGILKPDVVFFGESVPKAVVERAWRLHDEAELLLVVGSSLTVYSGRRFTDRAVRDGVPIAVVNLGPTRADEIAVVKVDGRLGEVLPAVVEGLA